MIETVKLTVRLSNFYKMSWINKAVSIALLLYIIVFSLYTLNTFPSLDVQNNVYGFTTDFCNLIVIVLIFLFWIVQCFELSKQAYVFSTLGLLLWSMGTTADVIDELVVQPYWMSVYFEDLCRTMVPPMAYLKPCALCKVFISLVRELITDDLTQVHNRRYFYRYVKTASATPYVILIVDIDHFKAINDEFGHDEGDLVLQQLATKYNRVFVNNAVFARLGGEEFGGYLPTGNISQAAEFCGQLIDIAHNIKVKQVKQLTVSIGMELQSANEPLDKVMKRADMALYVAKNNGRDQYKIAP
ncbi:MULTISPECIES: GGDEF domain-containing protein [unclassified Pseudoalteromonas]|uniref:GGDEF domain-containing protein n=1 Tax=unclassified Pseudoalteromonas TaxID=194690 RepID=UPI002359AE1D|nr:MULTISPECIES: GGDEF domain-containing protein [unclassified Pseudoalteromonas]MDC9564099.1 GGDEF domain-containing protein [Pseudoalteromonas sp. GAB2316C]MDC9568556.1 GGDEF domain-containing protein [Pseudoalteromonas sp. GABNB9D]MDC9572896.1 GGDEF domain-containing protein [Pseudoalteromonas sp. GABNS16A]MDC9577003.1 GGDEF domain-containing protein [Pseudoalteromonas sp. GABNS16E]MDC9584498.1 GGDEF domain-containing protein [Pseudoalteromonas sp. GABNS16C]|tara:strand:- start:1127 stop:2026 length:900 start_codon:yes stop_codon:yes gene_type:complete